MVTAFYGILKCLVHNSLDPQPPHPIIIPNSSKSANQPTEIDALASRVKAEFDTFDLLFVKAGRVRSLPT